MNIATFIRYAVCIYNRYNMQKNNLVHQLESSTYVCNNPIFIKQYLDKEPNSFRNCYNLKYVKICLQHLYIPKIRHILCTLHIHEISDDTQQLLRIQYLCNCQYKNARRLDLHRIGSTLLRSMLNSCIYTPNFCIFSSTWFFDYL